MPPSLVRLNITAKKETTHHMRDGEVVLYQRSDSSVWQVRYKLSDRRWHCVSTRHRRLDWAMRVAGEMYAQPQWCETFGNAKYEKYIYPGATHVFDYAGVIRNPKFTHRYDREADQLSQSRIKTYLDRHIKN